MFSDVQSKLAPALAPTLNQEFATAFPTLSTFADTWVRSTSAKSHALSNSQVRFGPTFANADRIPLEPIPWMFIIPGLVIAALAGATLLPSRRTSRAATLVPSADAVTV